MKRKFFAAEAEGFFANIFLPSTSPHYCIPTLPKLLGSVKIYKSIL